MPHHQVTESELALCASILPHETVGPLLDDVASALTRVQGRRHGRPLPLHAACQRTPYKNSTVPARADRSDDDADAEDYQSNPGSPPERVLLLEGDAAEEHLDDERKLEDDRDLGRRGGQ